MWKGVTLFVLLKFVVRTPIVLAFLIALGVDKKNAEIDSEGIEHYVSSKTLKAMKDFLK